MFNLDGENTAISNIINKILRISGLFEGGASGDLTCTVYRIDPLDNYQFLTAQIGLREKEPMFGPFVYNDLRKPELNIESGTETLKNVKDDKQKTRNNLGFIEREGVKDQASYSGDGWRVWLSSRKKDWEKEKTIFEEKYIPILKSILDNAKPITIDDTYQKPLFPELWFQERTGRTKILKSLETLTTGSSIAQIARRIARALRSSFPKNIKSNENAIGIYLESETNWALISGNQDRLPEKIPHKNINQPDFLNAFEWVGKSTRPVLLSRNVRNVWETRFRSCGGEFDLTLDSESPRFAGACIVPILDLPTNSRSIGIIYHVSFGEVVLNQAHLFILSQLSRTISSCLSFNMPYPGFLWWSRNNLERGDATIRWNSNSIKNEIAEDFAKKLMPSGAQVSISQMQEGYSGASVYRLNVKKNDFIEIPRVLKIGKKDVIEKELRNYDQFVHNKALGGAARIDNTLAKRIGENEEEWGAIVYHLVGSNYSTASPWSEWAARSTKKDIELGLELLFQQLWLWFDPMKSEEVAPSDLLITQPFLEKDTFFDEAAHHNFQNPNVEDVRSFLETHFGKRRSRKKMTKVCVIHGDLHSDNIFSIENEAKNKTFLSQVALIDWGSVREKAHPLSDVSKLMVDLLYRVLWKKGSGFQENQIWTWNIVKNWEEELKLNKSDWAIAIIHQITKMLFYSSNSGASFFSQEARIQAWKDVKEILIKEIQ